MATVANRRSFFDPEPTGRLRAIAHAEPRSSRDVWALRELALADDDARVRAEATTRLAEATLDGLGWWLREGLFDEKPSVREAAWLGLAQHPISALLEHAEFTLDAEPAWWVRRAAIWTITGLPGAEEVLALALDDPQWRVRHAAARALSSPRLESFVRQLCAATTSPIVRETCRYVLGEPAPGAIARPLPLDDDPAVAAERLEEGVGGLPLATLVRLLADPHETLSAAAEAQLASHPPLEVARAVVGWLDEPRAESANEAALRILSELPIDLLELARELVVQARGRGRVAWAMAGLVESGEPELVRQALGLADRAMRGTAFLVLLGSGEEVDGAIDLAPRDRHAATRLLLGRGRAPTGFEPSPGLAGVYALHAARLSRDVPALLRLAGSESPLVRHGALEALRALHQDVRPLIAREPDPALRALGFTLDDAMKAVEGDEPIGQRAGAEFCLAHLGSLQPARVCGLSACLAESPDATLRGAAVRLLHRCHEPAALELLLRLNLDVDRGVRSLSAEALEAWPHLLITLRALVERTTDADVSRGAWQWIARLSDAPLEVLSQAHVSDARVLEHLEALRIAHGAAAAPRVKTSRPDRARVSPEPLLHARALGATGLRVSPLVLSGANELPVSGFLEAAARGIDTFFWEPTAETSTRFLRDASRECQVVAGTYHSGPAAIRKDVETALRRLRRERIEIFLLFWVRSSGRVSDENFAALEQLKAEGKLATFGFSTHLREVAKAALDHAPWPVLMTRLSLAHPGAETELLPHAAAKGTGVFTFTSTCYGRLLQPTPTTPAARAVECYQFAIERPGVSAAVMAPRTAAELEQALGALEAPSLPPEREAVLREHGRAVRANSTALNHFIRQVSSHGRAELVDSAAGR